jgi:protein-L-isoaspartate(D-aspartate) O-methyltransferase
MNAATTDASPEFLRAAMITKTRADGYIISSAVEQALHAVERHLFVPDATLEEAYDNDIVVTKRGPDGQVLSCLSQPSIVALQLEQTQVRPGHRVLEIGAGTGYNAALLAQLAGPSGRVTAIDVDTDIIEQAADRLAAAGVGNAEVVLGDGALGHPGGAPFDRIVAAVGAYGIPEAWLDQLAPGGRLVVPVRIRGSVSRSIAFERDHAADTDGVWRSVEHQMCGFVPLRDGAADDPRRKVPLTPDKTVTIQLNQEHHLDPAGLLGVFDRPRFEAWTGVTFAPMQSMEWMFLWLTCTTDSLCTVTVDPAAVDAGLVEPIFRTSTMAVPGERELAYLTGRVVGRTADGGRITELGVVGHSDTGPTHTEHMAAEIRTWATDQRDRTVQFELTLDAPADARSGTFFLDRPRPHHGLVVTWR